MPGAYIQITTRCNMECGHCCFSCTKQGVDMDLETFRAACRLAAKRDMGITLGGGEPTLHKDFWQYFGLAMGACSEEDRLFIVTNGTNCEIAIALARMARSGAIGAALSRTMWHLEQAVQPHPSVVAAFTDGLEERRQRMQSGNASFMDLRELREETGYRGEPFAHGRAAEWGLDGECCCDSLHIAPNGNIFSCGCMVEMFGNVHSPAIPADYWERDEACGKKALAALAEDE